MSRTMGRFSATSNAGDAFANEARFEKSAPKALR